MKYIKREKDRWEKCKSENERVWWITDDFFIIIADCR